MSLRIRRGTDTERKTILFDEGEIVYAADQKKLYVGDGTTTGGVHILATSAGSGLTFDSVSQTLKLATQTNVLPQYATSSYPNSPALGTLIFDNVLHQFFGWNGSAWVRLDNV